MWLQTLGSWVWVSICMFIPFLWIRCPSNTLMEILWIWLRHSLGVADELKRLKWSEVKGEGHVTLHQFKSCDLDISGHLEGISCSKWQHSVTLQHRLIMKCVTVLLHRWEQLIRQWQWEIMSENVQGVNGMNTCLNFFSNFLSSNASIPKLRCMYPIVDVWDNKRILLIVNVEGVWKELKQSNYSFKLNLIK